MTQQDLFFGCKKRDIKVQNELMNRYWNPFIRMCLKYTKNYHDAEDVVQEGFVRVFSKIDSFKSEGSFEGWMKKIMINVARKKYVSLRAQYEKTEDTSILVSPGSVGEYATSKLTHDEIMKKINLLPKGYKKVFTLFAIEGYTHEKISEILGIKTGTSRSQYVKARRTLQKILQEHNK